MNNKNFTYLWIFLGVAILIAASQLNRTNTENVQAGISDKILRLHVIANSDSDEDQALKLKVKDKVVEYLETLLDGSNSLDESMDIVAAHYDDINNICSEVIKNEGYSYPVNSVIENTEFPVKSYGDITLPAGSYTALRITIGESLGKNWWCILYPPLCFVDATCGVVPDDSKKELKNILSENEYEAILSHDADVSFRFKYLTFFNDLF